jgi:hypothetical protein
MEDGEVMGGLKFAYNGKFALVLGVSTKGPSIGCVNKPHTLKPEKGGIRGAVELTSNDRSDGAKFTDKGAPMTDLREAKSHTLFEVRRKGGTNWNALGMVASVARSHPFAGWKGEAPEGKCTSR